MRLFRLLSVGALAAAALAACRDDSVTNATRPPLAGVRYINAVGDTGRVDIKMIDQVEYSANTNDGGGGITYRQGTRFMSTDTRTARRIRVFSFQDSSAAGVQRVIHDTSIAFEANKRYTLLLTGSARASGVRFRVIDESAAPTPAAGQIAVRVYNAGAGPVDAYLTDTTTAAVSGAPAIANVADFTASSYATRAVGRMAVRFTAAGATTVVASTQAAPGAAGTSLVNPQAGALQAGTVFTAYVFPRSVASTGAPQTAAFQTGGVVLFVDKEPPLTATSSQ